jgi:hypothetical protein
MGCRLRSPVAEAQPLLARFCWHREPAWLIKGRKGMHSNPPARGGWDRSVAGCRVRIMVVIPLDGRVLGIAMHVPASLLSGERGRRR